MLRVVVGSPDKGRVAVTLGLSRKELDTLREGGLIQTTLDEAGLAIDLLLVTFEDNVEMARMLESIGYLDEEGVAKAARGITVRHWVKRG